MTETVWSTDQTYVPSDSTESICQPLVLSTLLINNKKVLFLIFTKGIKCPNFKFILTSS